MKKVALILIAVFATAVILTSCKSQGPICPAYGQDDQIEIRN